MTTKDVSFTNNKNKGQATSRFQKLWAEAEVLAKENTELENQLDRLVGRIDKEVLSAEREMGTTVRLMVYRQLEFANRKSLLKWQREELDEWISDNLSELNMLGLLDEPLHNAVAELRAFQLGITLNPDSELSSAEQLDEYFSKFTEGDDWLDANETTDNSETMGLFDEESDEYNELADDEALAELLRKLQEEAAEQPEVESQTGVDKQVVDSAFKRLFRQTAAALHPDKELDDDRRQEKHVLMSQLLKARKERDLITIVKLHESHAAADSSLSGVDEEALEEVLVDYLNQQQSRMDSIIQKTPLHHMAYSEFYSDKPAAVTQKINAHLKKINERRRSLNDFLAEVKTLKSLKPILEARYESRVFQGEWY